MKSKEKRNKIMSELKSNIKIKTINLLKTIDSFIVLIYTLNIRFKRGINNI